MISSAVLAAAVAAIKVRAITRGSRYAKWVPSGIAFAIGFLNTPSFSMARLIGGIVEHVYHTRARRKLKQMGGGNNNDGAITIILVGSGFVLGEGVISIVGLVLKTFGVPSSCFACLEGVCSC